MCDVGLAGNIATGQGSWSGAKAQYGGEHLDVGLYVSFHWHMMVDSALEYEGSRETAQTAIWIPHSVCFSVARW